MSRHPAGTLTIKLKSFKGIEGEDGLGNNDVYFKVTLGHEHFKSKVHEGAGRSGDLSDDAPIVFQVSDKEAQRKNLVFHVYDKDMLHDDHLAEGELAVADAIQLAQTTVKMQPKGSLSITMDFVEAPVHHDARAAAIFQH